MLTLLSVSVSAVLSSPTPGLMNAGGVPYEISNPEGSSKTWRGHPGKYSTNFIDSVEGDVDFFDVYGEVQTRYSQVYWTRNLPIDLPDGIKKKFANGGVMAITGYEVDQVTHDRPPTPAGKQLSGFSCYPACDESDKSVPIYNAYNHHYFSWLTGSDSEVVDLEEAVFLPNPTYTAVRDKVDKKSIYPSNIVFKENPGGEFRKSYHGYPSGYAQLIAEPTQWVVEPMQIDTHNRKFGINEQPGFVPDFIPKIQQDANVTMLGAALSPLIECPCSTRITKETTTTPELATSGVCAAPISSTADCVSTLKALGVPVSKSSTVNSGSVPAGCSINPQQGGEGKTVYEAVYNSDSGSKKACGGENSGKFAWSTPMTKSAMNCAGKSCLPNKSEYGCTGRLVGQCTWDSVEQAKQQCALYPGCEAFFCSTKYTNNKLACFARGAGSTLAKGITGDVVYQKVYADELGLGGSADLSPLPVSISLSRDATNATFTLSGPSSVWFGVGFDAKVMSDAPYAIIVDGNGAVQERRLASHAPGTALAPSLTVLSSSVQNGVRTVVLQRRAIGQTSQHWSVPTHAGSVNIISAVGNTVKLAFHKQQQGSSILLLPTKQPTCVCTPSTSTFINYMNVTRQAFNGYNCNDEPRSDMKYHGDGTGRNVSNMACHAATYHGGLRCCKHTWFLTDLEDEARVSPKVDTYYLKWRYYFQVYRPATPTLKASHLHLKHWVFLIDATVNDYEEDNAQYGHQSIGKIQARVTGATIGLEEAPKHYNTISWFVMTPHYHAPDSIRQELWNADTNEIICNATARYGDPAYGPTSAVFNEAEYVAISPCLYGNQTGLQTPFVVTPQTNLHAIKYFNNTYRHLGQMAQWTGLMRYDTDPY